MRILLVDDDTGVIQALLPILKGLPGHELKVATTGDQAIANAASLGGLDLLITDVVMEPMDGFTLRDHLAAQYPGLRTILISGYDLSDYPEQTANHQLLAKPIDADVLREAVAREMAAEAAPEPVAEPEPAPEIKPEPVAAPVAAAPEPIPEPAAIIPEPVPAAQVEPEPVAPVADPVPAPVAVPVPVVVKPTVRVAAVPPTAAPVAAVPGATPRAVPTPTAVPVARAAQPVAVATAKATPVALPTARAATPPATGTPVAVPAANPPGGSAATVRLAATGKLQPVPVPSTPRAVVQAAPGSQVAKAVPAAAPAPVAPASSGDVRTVRATAVPTAVAVPKVARPGLPTANPGAPAAPKVASAAPKAAPVAPAKPSIIPSAVSATFVPPAPEVGPGELDGQMLGSYQLHKKIAEGRWGTVYSGRQTSINRAVGVEVLDSTKAEDPVARGRFIADARAKAQVQHPSILAVYEAGEADGRVFYAHEFVDGRTLAEMKVTGQRLDEPAALKVLRVAAEGLAYFAQHHVPHQPPEASSIYLGTDGQARLANLATQVADAQLAPDQEIPILGRIMLSVLPSVQSLSPGFRELLKRTVQPGAQALTSWGALLQGIKAIEPKIIPVEAAKISAQDRAAIAAVEQVRKQQKRALYINLASGASLLAIVAGAAFYFFSTNERALNEQVDIPAGEFIFGNGEKKTLPEFWIDKYEVTIGQYAKFVKFLKDHPTTEFDAELQPPGKSNMMHQSPHWDIYYQNAVAGKAAHGVPIDLNCPVMEVDIWDAYAYAKWKGRELPSEQEWEKAARGTKGRIYPWGDEFDPKMVNSNADYDANHPDLPGKVDGFNFWNPVDKIKGDKSEFGVIGMAGNVREWTRTIDPVKRRFVIKGGSFKSSDVRLDQRTDNWEPGMTEESLGFRTVSHTPPKK